MIHSSAFLEYLVGPNFFRSASVSMIAAALYSVCFAISSRRIFIHATLVATATKRARMVTFDVATGRFGTASLVIERDLPRGSPMRSQVPARGTLVGSY